MSDTLSTAEPAAQNPHVAMSEPTTDGPATMSGGEAIVRAAMANGIDTVFGIPGAQIYPLFDAMVRLGVRVVYPRHEQAAAYMAMGAANSTGRPSCFAVVPGPGILNATAALCTAMGTCSPVLGLTGQVPSGFYGKGRGHLHELSDQQGVLARIVKAATFIADPVDASSIMNSAFTTMRSGRPGPVTVEMCWDTMAAPHEGVTVGPSLAPPTPTPVDPDAFAQALALIRSAKRPMIMCGKGAQHAPEDVLALAELLDAPVTAFRSGRGVVAEDHDLGVSSLAARLLFDETDLVIGLGSRLEMLSMRWATPGRNEPRNPNGPKLIRVDVDEAQLASYPGDADVVGDVALFCRAAVDELVARHGDRSPIAAAKERARRLAVSVQPQVDYLDAIRDVLPRDGFFVPELSQTGFTSYFAFPVLGPRTYVTEGFQGTLGFGYPTALGVKVANPSRQVVAATGDGGFLFGIQELATAAAEKIAAVAVVFNNNSYGNVRRDQMNVFGGRLAGADLANPDFVRTADAFGLRAERVGSPNALRVALDGAFSSDQPAVIEVELPVGSEANPWPFIHMKDLPQS